MKKIVNVNLNISLRLVLDSESDNVDVVETSATVLNATSDVDNSTYVSSHVIKETENKYGILTLGTKSISGMLIPTSHEIKIVVNEDEFRSPKPIFSHKHTRGRIDGLTKLYREYPDIFEVGSQINISFDQNNSVLSINK